MWGDGGNFNMGEGGFVDSSFNSPSADGEKKGTKDRRAENAVPVTIKQILDGGESLKVGNIDVHVVSFIGIIRSMDAKATKLVYDVEDTTGQIEAVLWLDGPLDGNEPHVGMYCHVLGTLRTIQGKCHVMIFKYRALADLNELTSHLLEVVDVHLNAPLMSENMENMNTSANKPMTATTQSLASSDMSYIAQMGGVQDPKHRMVMKVIEDYATQDIRGVHIQFIADKLNGKMTRPQVKNSLDHLTQEGFIFSTVDDEHFTVTK